MNKQKHRHLVAAPIAILAILAVATVSNFMPVLAGSVSGRMTVHLSASSDDEAFHIGGGVAGILREGSDLLADDFGTGLSLRKGQVLLRAPEILTLTLSDTMAVTVIHGSFVAVRDGETVTLAALDMPLLLANGDALTVLPPGRQLTMTPGAPDQNTSIGGDWYASQLSDLSTLESPRPRNIDDVRLADALETHDLTSCVSIATEGHLARPDLQTALAALLTAGKIDRDTYACIRELAHALDSSGALGKLVLLTLATEAVRTDTATSDMIAADFRADPFLKSAFPEILPVLAMTRQRPVQPSLINAFANTVIEAGLADPARALTIIRRASGVPRTLAAAGLPLQSQAWKSAIARAIVVLKTTVPEADRALLDVAFAEVVSMPEEVKPKAAAPAPEAPSTQWSEDELIAITHDVLASHGALFAVTTVLTPDAKAQTVLVEGIFVAEGGANVPYAFTYDPAKERVMKIIRDGHRLPNAVPVQTFFGS